MAHGLTEDGLDVDEVFAKASLREGGEALPELLAFARAPARPWQAPAPAVWALWDEIVSRRGSLSVAFRYGAMVPANASSQTVRMLATTSPTLRDAAFAAAQFSPLFAQAYSFAVRDEGDGAGELAIAGHPDSRGAAADLAYLVAVICRWSARMLGRAIEDEIAWETTWAERDRELEEVAKVPIRFGAPRDIVRFSAAAWTGRTATGDVALHARLEESARAEMSRLRPTLTERVRAALANASPSQLGAEDIAKKCAVSTRTMRRELHDEGTTFQKLLDEWRRATALAWLDREDDRALADRLGFADARSFRRAFSTWTGTSPSRARDGRGSR